MIITVVIPQANATRSENDVTVTETPACCIVTAILSSIGSLIFALFILFHVVMMTNASSTPTAENVNENIQVNNDFEVRQQRHQFRPTF